MLSNSEQQKFLARIEGALDMTREVAKGLTHPDIPDGSRHETIKNAERRLSDALREALLQPGEGWLCEEDADDPARLGCEVAWVIDPVDGTQEFITNVPEWSISVGLVVDGDALAGGIYNPMTDELFLGSLNLGITYNGRAIAAPAKTSFDNSVVLASRQEFKRGEWTRFERRQFTIRPTGSIAYKLALVAAGLADATWTLSPKNEWDVAAGVALINAAGARVSLPGGAPVQFNRKETLLPGLVASQAGIWHEVNSLLAAVAPSCAGTNNLQTSSENL
jgi:myo-inositol-1(or 4)-monophosphatase